MWLSVRQALSVSQYYQLQTRCREWESKRVSACNVEGAQQRPVQEQEQVCSEAGQGAGSHQSGAHHQPQWPDRRGEQLV